MRNKFNNSAPFYLDFAIILIGNANSQASDVANIARNMTPTRWCLDGGRNKLATCSPQTRNIAHNMYTMSGGGRGCNMGKGVRNTMFGCWSQHARHKLATFSLQTRNMYTMSGEEGGGATWKKCSQLGKRCSQHGKSVRNMGKGVHNMEKVFATRFATSWSDADMFPDSNRVAGKVSDASARIGRPDANSSVS
jgi:hypothetical protein